jgi:hypothetical protein
MAHFNVVVNLNDDDQEIAWRDCAGLVRLLSRESREFVFSAALAAELLPDLAWDPDPKVPTGVNLGVLYKGIQTASVRYVDNYLIETARHPLGATQLDASSRMTELPTHLQNAGQKHEKQTEEGRQRMEDLLQGQTAMMGSMTEIEKAARKLLDISRKAPDATKNECEATFRDALGSQYDELAAPARDFLLAAEWGYIQNPSFIDCSAVVLNLTKVFEVEFHRAIKPLREILLEVERNDISSKGIFLPSP